MLDKLLQTVAPHPCSGCGKLGDILCGNCEYDIISEPVNGCVLCQRLTGVEGICKQCHAPFERAWCVGLRTDALETLIDSYKFSRAVAAGDTLGGLIDARLPDIPDNTIVIPIPTIQKHIRQRGYDHALLIARAFARRRSLQVQPLIKRRTQTVQRDAGRTRRIQQAQEAFVCPVVLDPDSTYLIVDDVITTGATALYASATLKKAGAQHIWVAAVSRQPLDQL